MTPTQRTLKWIREQGFVVGVVERWVGHAPRPGGGRGVRIDFLGIIDIIYLDPLRGVVGVQSTGQAFSEHHRALTGDKRGACVAWLSTPGAHLELIGWRTLKEGNRRRWRPRITIYSLEDF